MKDPRLAISLATGLAWLLITVLGGHLRSGGQGPLADAVTQGLGWPFLAAAGLLLLVERWQRWNDIGLNAPISARSLLLTWLPLLYIVGGLALAVALGLPPAGVLSWIVINTFLVGLSEELMFRGVLLAALQRTLGIWPAVAWTALAFGAVHSLNVFVTGELRSALLQSVAATLSGLLFIALRLRTCSLWPGIAVHGLWDSVTFLIATAQPEPASAGSGAPSGLMSLAPILLVLPNGLYGLWLMRRLGRAQGVPASSP